MKSFFSKAFELLPALSFLVFYSLYDLKTAIDALVVYTILFCIPHCLLVKKITGTYIFTTSMVIVFGGLSMFSDNPIFIKLKPTFINLIWASLLTLDLIVLNKGFLKKIVGHVVNLPDIAWKKLTIVWIVFFILCAVLNEFVWRNYSEADWVYFKLFGLSSMSLGFSILSVLYMQRKYNKN